jgi:hypothetical protein
MPLTPIPLERHVAPRALMLPTHKPTLVFGFLVAWVLLLQAPLAAQEEAQEAVPRSEEPRFATFVEAFVEIEDIRDELQSDLARWHEADRKAEVRREADDRIARALEARGIHRETFNEFTRMISTDADQRSAFEEAVARLRDTSP